MTVRTGSHRTDCRPKLKFHPRPFQERKMSAVEQLTETAKVSHKPIQFTRCHTLDRCQDTGTQRWNQWLIDDKFTMCMFVPLDIYCMNAKGFADFKEITSPNLVRMYSTLFQVFGFILKYCHERGGGGAAAAFFDPIPDREKPDQLVGFWYWITAYQHPADCTSFAAVLKLLIDENNEFFTKISEGKLKPPRNPLPSYRYLTTSRWKQLMTDFFVLDASASSGYSDISDDTSIYNICNRFAFDREARRAFNLGAAEEWCNPRQYFKVNAAGERLAFKFPDPSRVYHVGCDDMSHNNFHNRYFPWAARPVATDYGERATWQKMNRINCAQLPDFFRQIDPVIATKIRDVDESNVSEFKKAIETIDEESIDSVSSSYDSSVNVLIAKEAEFTLDEFRKQTIAVMTDAMSRAERIVNERIRQKNITDPQEQQQRHFKMRSQLRRAAQQDALKNFRQVWSEDGAIPPALKAIVSWGRKHLRDHKNFCMPRKKVTNDIDYGLEEVAHFACMTETVDNAYTSHMDLVKFRIALFHLYLRTMLQLHSLRLGDKEVGKSWAIFLIASKAIEGTTRVLSYFTDKSFTAGGFANDSIALFFDEAPPTLLFPVEEGRKAGNGGTELGAALMKNLMTRGVMSYNAMIIEKDGTRTEKNVDVPCHMVIIAAGNFVKQQISAPLLSRFQTEQCVEGNRPDKTKIAAKTQDLIQSTEFQRLKNVSGSRFHRDQYFAAYIGSLIYGGVLSCIDKTVVNILFTWVMQYAREAHLPNTQAMRDAERFFMMCDSIAMQRASGIILDSPVSEYGLDEAWQDENILSVEKHLKVSVADCVLAFGLLEHQWYNKIRFNVIRALDAYMKTKAKTTAVTNEQVRNNNRSSSFKCGGDEDDQKRMEDYGAAQIPRGNMALSDTYDNAEAEDTALYLEICPSEMRIGSDFKQTNYQNNINTALLATLIAPYMNPKPQLSDIEHALKELLTVMIDVGDGKTLPGLDYKYDYAHKRIRVRMSRKMRDENKEGVFFECVRKAVCTRFARPQTVLYGQPDPNIPCKFMTMDITPDPNANQPSIIRPDYRDPEMQEWNKAYLEGVEPNEPPPVLAEMWTTERNIVLNMDLDEYATTIHNHRIALPKEELKSGPSNNPVELEKQIALKTRRYDQLKSYKMSFIPNSHRRMQSDNKRKSMSEEVEYKQKLLGITEETESEEEDSSDDDDDDNENVSQSQSQSQKSDDEDKEEEEDASDKDDDSDDDDNDDEKEAKYDTDSESESLPMPVYSNQIGPSTPMPSMTPMTPISPCEQSSGSSSSQPLIINPLLTMSAPSTAYSSSHISNLKAALNRSSGSYRHR